MSYYRPNDIQDLPMDMARGGRRRLEGEQKEIVEMIKSFLRSKLPQGGGSSRMDDRQLVEKVERIQRILEIGASDDDIIFLRNLIRENNIPKHGLPVQSSVGNNEEYVQINIPSYWSENINMNLNEYKEIYIPETSEEYNKVSKRFFETVRRHSHDQPFKYNYYQDLSSIIKIKRIENLKQWMHYELEKLYLSKKNGFSEINEEYLFHGTTHKEIVDAIIRNGFAKTMISKHMYGKGLYFSPFAGYSALFAREDSEPPFVLKENSKERWPEMKDDVKIIEDEVKRVRIMFLCRVLCGRKKKVRASDPLYCNKSSPPEGFDSHVSNDEHKIQCIFSPLRVYPEYVIEFERGNIKVNHSNYLADFEVKKSSTMVYDPSQSDLNIRDREINISLQNVDSVQNYGLIPETQI
jgi:hypothetical protein